MLMALHLRESWNALRCSSVQSKGVRPVQDHEVSALLDHPLLSDPSVHQTSDPSKHDKNQTQTGS